MIYGYIGVIEHIATYTYQHFTSICVVWLAVHLDTRLGILGHCRAVLRDAKTMCGLSGYSHHLHGDEPWYRDYGPGEASLPPCNVHTATLRSRSTADKSM